MSTTRLSTLNHTKARCSLLQGVLSVWQHDKNVTGIGNVSSWPLSVQSHSYRQSRVSRSESERGGTSYYWFAFEVLSVLCVHTSVWIWVWARLCEHTATSYSARYVRRSHFGGFFSCFFQDLSCEFVIHCNKRHIFLCLFVLFAQYHW